MSKMERGQSFWDGAILATLPLPTISMSRK